MNDPIDDAVAAAASGRLIVLPTDTLYGIGTRPDDSAATARLYAAKRRPRDLELPVLVASLDAAAEIASFDPRTTSLASRFWPGPLTIVLRRGEASAAWDLGGDGVTVGVRIPRHPLAIAVLERTGPLAVTSANLSGVAPPSSCEEIHAVFGDAVDVYLCQETPPDGTASTVLDLAGDEPVVVRQGAIPTSVLLDALDV